MWHSKEIVMQGIDRYYADTMIDALFIANSILQDTTISEAVEASHVPYKGDTLGLDQNPEDAIRRRLREADNYAAIVTEEKGEDVNPLTMTIPEGQRGARTFFTCDPTDRSSELQQFLIDYKGKGTLVGDVIRDPTTKKRWEENYGAPASITGANAAITCVRRGIPICSTILNYITQELTVACSAGIFHTSLGKRGGAMTLHNLQTEKNMMFVQQVRDRDDQKRFVTFMGKPARGYPQNIINCKLMPDDHLEQHIHYKRPGGPTRMLYLTRLQSAEKRIGFIMANGEKIGEWMHWLPYIRCAVNQTDMGENALRLFEISQDSSLMRDGYLLMPSPIYSIFAEFGEVVKQARVSVDRLQSFANPSKYRATLLITPSSNTWVLAQVEKHGYREIRFADL